MNTYIPVSFHTMPQNIDSLSRFLESIRFKRKVMVFFSKGCYEIIKNSSDLLGETIYPFNSKNFVMSTKDKTLSDSFSFIHMYSGEWVYLENFFSDTMYCDSIFGLPKEIKFVCVENEFLFKEIKTFIISSNDDENPLTGIIDNYDSFKNSLLILTDSSFKKLSMSTNLVSRHKGIYRLSWNSDHSYPGGSITLKSFNNGGYYLLENMDFAFFQKNFDVKSFPNAVFFIT